MDDQLTVEQRLFDENEDLRDRLKKLEKKHNNLLKSYQGRYYTITSKKKEMQTLERKIAELTGKGKEKYKNKKRGKRR